MKRVIDLDSMTVKEPRKLNREIVQRSQLASFVRNKSQLMAFRIGGFVVFESDHGTGEGMVTRGNQKTVSIDGDDWRGYRVPPCFFSKFVGPAPIAKKQGNLFSMPSKNAEQR
jgi:hypothetical protein